MISQSVRNVALALALACAMIFVHVADALAQDATMQAVIKRGRLLVGVRDTSPGFSFRDDKGELVGFEIDIARELARGLFKDPSKVDFVMLSGGADRVPALVSGRADAVISTMSAYLERARVVEFSLPYCISKPVFIVAKDSPFRKTGDLDGKRITSRQGADLERILEGALKAPSLQMYPNNADALLALRQKRADAFFFEGGAALYLARSYADELRELIDDDRPLDPSYLAVAVKQGEQVWLNYLNWALTDMKLNGRLREFHVKWFGSESLLPSWARQPM